MSDRKYLKWSNTTVNDADQYGNVWTANNIGNVPYGDFEGWYIGINPPVGGYTWYRYDTSGNGPWINCPSSDTSLVNLYNNTMGTSFSNVPQVADAIESNDNQLLDGDVVRDGLLLYMDPNKTSSYPGTGTAVTNIAPSGSTNNIDGTLTDASMWVNPGGGSPAYFRVETDDSSNVKVLTFDSTISRAGNGDSTILFYWWSDYNGGSQYSNSQAFFGGKYTNYMALRSLNNSTTNYWPEAETDGVGEPEGNHDYFGRENDGAVFNVGEWNSWVSIFDSGTASNWYNGVENSNTYALGSATTHSFPRLGSTSTGSGGGDRGGDIRMGTLLIYNRVLSDAEIRKNLDIFDQWYSND